MIQPFASSSDRPSRLKRLLTGGIVATVLGGLLATGMTSVATAAVAPTLTVNVTSGGTAVVGMDVEVYEVGDDYTSSIAYGTTNSAGKIVLNDQQLKTGTDYVVSVSKSYATPDEFTPASNGFVDGTSTALVDDFADADPVVLSAGANTRNVALSTGATITGSVFAPNGDDFADQSTQVTAYRKSVDLYTGEVKWDFEGQAGTVDSSDPENVTVTNDYSISGLRAGNYVLSFYQAEEPSWASLVFNDGKTGIASATPVAVTRDAPATIDGTFAASGSIGGTVTLPSGFDFPITNWDDEEPLEEVWVSATLQNADGSLDESGTLNYPGASVDPETGTYLFTGLGQGNYFIEFKAGDSGLRNEWYDNEATSATATAVATGSLNINAELGEGFDLVVNTDSGSGKVSGATVSVYGTTTDDYVEKVSTSTGVVTFENLSPDAYEVEVEYPTNEYPSRYATLDGIGSTDYSHPPLISGVDGEVEVGVTFPGTSTTLVTILDPAGNPLKAPYVYVAAEAVKNGALDREVARSTGVPVAGKQGVYSLKLVPNTEYTVLVDADLATTYAQYLGGIPAYTEDALASATTFNSGTGNALTFSLAASGKISGVVKSTANKALQGVSVEIFEYNGSEWVHSNGAWTSKTGTYSAPVRPGSYKVGFATSQGPSSGFVGTYEFNVSDIYDLPTVYVGKNGTATVNTSLAPAGSISGVVANGAGVVAANVGVRPILLGGESDSPLQGHTAYTNAKGAFTITGLPAGTYALSFDPYTNADLGDTYVPNGENVTYTVAAGKATKIASKILLPAAAARKTATVTGTLSSSVPGATGWVDFYSTDGLHYGSAEISGTGQFSTNLIPGHYTYEATFEGSAPLVYRPITGTRNFGAGDNTLTIDAIIKNPLAFDELPTIVDVAGANPVAGVSLLQAIAAWDAERADSSYQWFRNGVPVFGAHGPLYATTGADAGADITVRVTLDNRFGNYSESYETVFATSPAFAIGGGEQLQSSYTELIASSTAPGGVISAVVGWNPYRGVAYSYRWFRDGELIEGVTSRSYTILASDVGSQLSVETVAHKIGYTDSAAWYSDYVTATLGSAPTNTKKPTVAATTKGVPAGLTKYTATPGTWSVTGTTPSYAWYLDGVQVGADPSYLLASDVPAAQALTVRVTASKAGLAESAPVEVLARKGSASPTANRSAAIYDWNTEDLVEPTDEVSVGTKLYVVSSYTVPTGSTNASTYVWQRQTGAKWATIAKATASQYTLTAADAGKNIRAVVTTSAPFYATLVENTAPVAAVLDPALRIERADSVSISGSGVVSSTLTAVVETENEITITGTKTTYQWGVQVGGDSFTAIKGATKPTFVVPANLVGKEIRVVVTTTKAGYEPSVEKSHGVIASTGSFTILTGPTITNPVRVGSKLTAKAGTTDVTGAAHTFVWSWYDEETEESVVAGTGATFTPAVADLGKLLRLTETVTKSGFETRTASSAPYEVLPGIATVKTAPKVTTTASAYTVSAGASVPAAPATYQWLVSGEESVTTANYPRSSADAGKLIAVVVTYSVAGYADKTVYLVAQKAEAPELSGTLLISGAQVGVASMPTGGFPQQVPGATAQSTYAFQWLLAGKPIKGATAFSYGPTAAQVGKSLSLKITSTSAEHATAVYTSEAITVLAGAAASELVYLGNQDVVVGTTVTAYVEAVQPGYTLTYQWLRSPNGNGPGVAIPKATNVSYTTVLADQNAQLTLRVKYTRAGYETREYTTGDVWVYGADGLSLLEAPVLTGTGAVGSPLTVTPATWNLAVTQTYTWYRNNVEVPGVTGASYTPLGDHVGDVIHVEVEATRPGFNEKYASTGGKKITLGAAPVATGAKAPKVTGTAKTCATLSATPGVWSVDGVALSYQWYRVGLGESPIEGATSNTYTTVASDLGAKILVKVTATVAGYAVGTSASAETAALTETPGCGAP